MTDVAPPLNRDAMAALEQEARDLLVSEALNERPELVGMTPLDVLGLLAHIRQLEAGPKLPKHVSLSIQHNPHAGVYQTVEAWLEQARTYEGAEIEQVDADAMLASGEVWTVSWCPDTPVGSCFVAAATLDRALELAQDGAS